MKVDRKLINDLGVQEQITPYSYEKGDTVYLEEDCDAFVVVHALRNQGHEVRFRELNSNDYLDRIRNLPSYKPRSV